MKATAFCGCNRGIPFGQSSSKRSKARTQKFGASSCFLVHSVAAQEPLLSAAKTLTSRKNSMVFPLGKPPRNTPLPTSSPVKLLTRVEQLKLLSKAEKAGLLSAKEKFGPSLSTIEKLNSLEYFQQLQTMQLQGLCLLSHGVIAFRSIFCLF